MSADTALLVVDGLQGIEMTPLLGRFTFDLYGKTAYWYAVAVLFVLFWAARKLVHSPFGLSLKGIRLNVARMPAIGAPVNARLSAIYTIGAAYAGIAGALLAQTTQFVALDVLSFNRSAELMLILVLGGSGSLYGAVIGGYVLGLVTILLQSYLPLSVLPYRDALVFGFVIVLLLLRPQGLFPSRALQERV